MSNLAVHNNGFSDMLVLEYILFVPLAFQRQSQLNEYYQALEYNLSFLPLLSNIPNLRGGLK